MTDPRQTPDATDKPAARDERGVKTAADDDNLLESMGKAVSAPVLGAADEDPEEPDKQPPRA
jgi:hypothetical protein